MERISVVGCSGSGKTRMAGAIAAALGVPRLELDGVYHQRQWAPLPGAEFLARVSAFAEQPRWVMRARAMRGLPSWLVSLACLCVLGACASSDAAPASPAAVVPAGPCPDAGVVACTCADGRAGARNCEPGSEVGRGPDACDCAGTPGTDPANPGEPMADAGVAPPGVAGPGTIVAEPQDEAATIYDQLQLRTFEVELAPADLAAVDANPTAEQYVPAVLRFDGVSYDVGYRYKGSLGAFQAPCTARFGGGPKNGKCSVKLSFNWTDPEGRFFGLKKLQFHAMNVDPSMLRERLGYAMFREHGVPAPRAVHAILTVNGQSDLYALVEQIDGRFTRSRFTEGGEGNLYKEIWPLYTDPQAYLDALTTNEDQSPSVDRMLQFASAVSDGPAAFEAWVDPEVMARYMAVDRVIMNDDGAFHLYCFDGAIGNNLVGPANHNYYWYGAADYDRFWIIPWDLDHAMAGARGPAHIPVDWRLPQEPSTCSCSGRGFPGTTPAGCDPVFQILRSWEADYERNIDAFIAGPFSKANVDALLSTWRRQIEDAGYGVPQAALDSLTSTLDSARSNRGFVYR